jgi:transposase-like protein
MAAAKRYTAEQIVAKLREAEKLQAQGATVPQVCKKLGCSEQTFYRWRTKYGALKEDEAPAYAGAYRNQEGNRRIFSSVNRSHPPSLRVH